MGLLDTSPAELCRSTAAAFHIQSDLDRLSAVSENIHNLSQLRTQELDTERATLRALSRTLDATKTSAEAALQLSQRREHAKTILDLDRRKFALAKNVTELEKSNHLMEANLGKLKDEVEGLEGEGVMQAREALGEDDTM